tara:strand:- start:2307 stop:2423 length:117 start_codon:yes stop_codon:yes gene_type:complete
MSKPDETGTFVTPNGLTFWKDFRGRREMPSSRSEDAAN